MIRRLSLLSVVVFLFSGCPQPMVEVDGGGLEADSGTRFDAGTIADAGLQDAGSELDAGADGGPDLDAGIEDAGIEDAGADDAGTDDAGTSTDGGSADAGSSIDAGTTDAGIPDGGITDAGTSSDAGSSDAGLDLTPPTVTMTTPANNATNVVITNRTFTVTFSEAIDPSTLTGITAARSSTPVAVTCSWNAGNNTATCTLADDPLAYGTGYTITIANVRDLSGNSMSSPRTLVFTTAADPRPQISAVFPLAGQHLIPLNSAVTITFTRDLDQTTVNATNISIAGVAATLAYNTSQRRVTVTPSAPFAAGTDYTLTVSTGIRDTVGTALPQAWVSSFRTVAVPVAISGDTRANRSNVLTAFNTAGDGIAAWSLGSGAAYSIYSASAGTWGPETVIPNSQAPRQVAASNTQFAVAWGGSITVISGGVATSTLINNQYSITLAGSSTQFIATWTGPSSSGTATYASIFNGTSWTTASMIGSTPHWGTFGSAAGFIVASSNGNTLNSVIWDGSAWVGAVQHQVSNFGAMRKVVFASNGTGFAIGWVKEYSGSTINQYMRVYSGGAWGTTAAWGHTPGGSSESLTELGLASDGSGYMATWYYCHLQFNSCTPAIHHSRATGTTWSTAAAIVSGATITAYRALAGGAGSYVVAFKDSSTLRTSTFNGTAWSTPVQLDAVSPQQAPLLRVDASGATAALCATYSDCALKRLAGGTWGAAAQFTAPPLQTNSFSVQRRGSGEVVIYDLDGEIFERTFNAGTLGAQSALPTTAGGRGSADEAQLVRLNDGTVVAAWLQSDGSRRNVYGARRINTTWSAPTLFATDANIFALATNGTTLAVVWSNSTSVSVRPISNGVPGTVTSLVTGTNEDSYVAIAGGQGFAVVWQQRLGSSYSQQGAISADGVTWTSPVQLRSGSLPSSTQFHVAGVGNTYAVALGGTQYALYDGTNWQPAASLPVSGNSTLFISDGTSLHALVTRSPPAALMLVGTTWNVMPLSIPAGGSPGTMSVSRQGTRLGGYYVWNGGTNKTNLAWSGTAWTTSAASYVDSHYAFGCDEVAACYAFRSSFSTTAGQVTLPAATEQSFMGTLSPPYSPRISTVGSGDTMWVSFPAAAASGDPTRIYVTPF